MYFKVQEFTLDYTHCKNIDNLTESCAEHIKSNRNLSCNCIIPFKLEEDFSVRYYIDVNTMVNVIQILIICYLYFI